MKNPYTYVKLFRNPVILAEMLGLKENGETTSALSRKYLCTRSAIMYQCRIANGEIQPKPKIKRIPTPYKYQSVIEEQDINKGFNYKDYLKGIKDQRKQEEEQMQLILMNLTT